MICVPLFLNAELILYLLGQVCLSSPPRATSHNEMNLPTGVSFLFTYTSIRVLCILRIRVQYELSCIVRLQQKEVSQLTAAGVLVLLPGALGFFFYEVVLRFLFAQEILWPVFFTGVVLNILAFGTVFIFLYVPQPRSIRFSPYEQDSK